MTTVIEDKDLERRVRRYRKRLGADRYDEVWDGVYVMAAMPNNEHQGIVNKLAFAFESVLGQPGRGLVFPGVNISDQTTYWKRNYRCPDVAVFLERTSAQDRGTHWYGGPDLAIEIVSPGDRSRLKLDFYAAVRTREVLILDRDPWRLELFRLDGTNMNSVGISTPEMGEVIHTESVPFTWRLVAGADRPQVELVSTENEQRWVV